MVLFILASQSKPTQMTKNYYGLWTSMLRVVRLLFTFKCDIHRSHDHAVG
jgi:hypothetical protein